MRRWQGSRSRSDPPRCADPGSRPRSVRGSSDAEAGERGARPVSCDGRVLLGDRRVVELFHEPRPGGRQVVPIDEGAREQLASEFEAYLRCGRLEYGLVQLACAGCGHTIVAGFSCRRRGFCPSCLGRRMLDIAAHLVEGVLPVVPVRQWVCSLPWTLRTAVGYDRALCSDVLGVFADALSRSLRHRAKRELGLESVTEAEFGAVTNIARSDSALRLNPHFHTLVLDGVYVKDTAGRPSFQALGEPSPEDVHDVARWTYQVAEQPVLASCYGASASDVQLLGAQPGQRTAKLTGPVGVASKPNALAVEVGGVNVHAGLAIDGRDRRRIERLVRYVARPPLAQDRVELHEDGRVRIGSRRRGKMGPTRSCSSRSTSLPGFAPSSRRRAFTW